MAAILNFEFIAKIARHKKMLVSRKPCEISDFGKSFNPQVICEDKPFQVSMNISLARNGSHFEFFEFFSKMQNTKIVVSQKPC